MTTPFVAGAAGHPIPMAATVAALSLGALLTLLGGVGLMVAKLYRKPKANEAFVRTGAGGVRVIRDGGAMIVPFVHEVLEVSLETLKLEVTRSNEDALITEDKLRADIKAEFFVRVQPDKDSILQASRSLGERMHDPAAVKALVEDKLVSALRTAAAMKTLEQLNSERDEFLAEVMKLVADDLLNNGLILETVTISRLDQTSERFLKDENIFDAQGRRKIAEITQLNLTERNRLVREGEQARKNQDVQTTKQLLDLDRAEKEAAAKQAAEVKKVTAVTEEEAQRTAIEAQRRVDLAAIEKLQALEVAARQQEQAVEVAERMKQERVAEAEKLRAAAERNLAEAEAERERARQQVETVRVTEEAERLKQKQVIDAQAQAEERYVAEQRKADAEAYALRTAAEAQKLAADAAAEAIRKKAAAEADAERQAAEGAKAKAMVPIEVDRARLEIDRDRVETVVKRELEAREKHGKVAQDFEVQKLRIEAEREVRIAIAEASATLFSKLEANLYGTPEDAQKILESMVRGQSVARTVGGFFEAADEATMGAVSGIAGSVQKLAGALAERVADQPEEVEVVASDDDVVEAAE
ncbi:MAG: SPFH domain-containing protein [Polyangiaceae bacterium]